MTGWGLVEEVNKKFYSETKGPVWLTDIKMEIAPRVIEAANLMGSTPGMPGYGYIYFAGFTSNTLPQSAKTDMVGIYKKEINT